MQNDNPSQPLDERMFQQDLPEASSAQILGILSIVFCGLIGMILAIVSLSKVKECEARLNQFPAMYTASSISKMKTGKICSIISLSILGGVVFIVILLAAIGGLH